MTTIIDASWREAGVLQAARQTICADDWTANTVVAGIIRAAQANGWTDTAIAVRNEVGGLRMLVRPKTAPNTAGPSAGC